jgi:hypothetical protein
MVSVAPNGFKNNKNMKITFENYLIMVGIRTADYTYKYEQIMDNIEYFRKCYNDNLSAYKALLFLHDHLQSMSQDDINRT